MRARDAAPLHYAQHSVLARLIDLYRREGLARTLRFLGKRLLRVQRHHVYRVALNPPHGGHECANPEGFVSVIVDEAAVLQRYPRVRRALAVHNREYLQAIFAGDALAVVVLSKNTVVHWSFVMWSSRTMHLLGLRDGDALLGNSFTTPEFRGRGLQQWSLRTRLKQVGKRGGVTAYAETAPDNAPSARAMEKSGMESILDLTIVVVGNHLVFRFIHRGMDVPRIAWCR